MADEVGVGYVRLVPSMRGFGKAAERQLSSALGGPSRKAGRDSGDAIGDEAGKSLNARMSGLAGGIMKAFGKELGATAKPTAATLATAFSGQFLASLAAGLASGAVKVAQGLGAAVALAPAVALAGAAAFGALKLAVAGVGDALTAGLTGDVEAFDEALKGLSPSAQAFAREVVGLKGGLDGLKATVQENFFAPLVDGVRPLVDAYLPQLEGLLGGVSRTFGQMASSIASFLTMPETAKAFAGAFINVGAAIDNVALGAGSLVQALVPLVVVGSTFLPQLTSGFGGLTARLASFMLEAQRTGQLAAFIQTGIDAIKSLIETGQQVGRIIGNIGSIFSTVFAGLGGTTGGLLDSLERLTERAQAFFATAAGSELMGQVFETLGAVADTLLGTLQRVFGILGDVFGPIMPDILDFIEAFADLKSAVLDTGLDALEPILHGLGAVLGGVVLPVLTGLANWLTTNRPLLQGIGIAIVTLLVPAFIAWAVSAGTAAIATLAAMLPIILLGAAIAILAALVITHFDTIKRWISNVFHWVKDNWPLLLAILTGPIGLAVLLITKHWDTIKAGITAVKDWIVARWNDVVGFITSIPGRLADAGSGMWHWILDSFKGIVNSVIDLWNGLEFKLPSFGGWDPPGPGPTIPGWEGPTIGFPDIPHLARGAIATGPTLAMVGEGGEDEVISPLSRLRAEIAGPMFDAMAAAGAPATAGSQTVLVVSPGGDRRFAEWIRHLVRVQGGGDVQVALGQVNR